MTRGFEIVAEPQNLDDNDSEVAGMKLTSIHEGAGIEYAFLGNTSRDFNFNESNNDLYFLVPARDEFGNTTFQQSLYVDLGEDDLNSGVVQFTIGGQSYVSIDDEGLIRVRNSNAFFACKNIPELAGYTNSVKNWAVMLYPYGGAPDTCVYIKLVAEGWGSSNSTSQSLTVSVSSTESSKGSSSTVSTSSSSESSKTSETSETSSISTDSQLASSNTSGNSGLINKPTIPLALVFLFNLL